MLYALVCPDFGCPGGISASFASAITQKNRVRLCLVSHHGLQLQHPYGESLLQL